MLGMESLNFLLAAKTPSPGLMKLTQPLGQGSSTTVKGLKGDDESDYFTVQVEGTVQLEQYTNYLKTMN